MYDKVKIFFCGDFCSTSSAKPITVSQELRDLIASCDLKVVNFEVPLKPELALPPQKRQRFCQHDDVPAFLQGLGFNLFSLATNHTFDWGEEGFKKTKAALGDTAFGAGTYDEAYKVKIVEVGGAKIGFMAVCFAAYTGVFNDVLKHEGLGCAYINDLKVNHVIADAKKDVDYLFVLPHDGIEYIDIPLPETIARYRDFIDWGADAVIGTHPHCPQGWEEYKGKPIFYSLGNFLFNSKEGYDYRATNRPHWYEGLCVVMTIKNGQLSWEVVNTRNVDNVGIEIDTNEDRNEHNKRICGYLKNKNVYECYFNQNCKEQNYRKYMKMIDCSFHPFSLKTATKVLFNKWLKHLRKIDFTDDSAIERLLSHDGNRSILLRSIRKKINNK
ncbi:MAG: CapA family protein [Prevotella sp.]|nr:CapA family protein [Prevotella sp.]